MSRSLGVVIARFQAPSLTEAHQHLLAQVASRVARVLVLLGTAPVPGLRRDPLEFKLREQMVHDYWATEYPDKEITILPISDHPLDREWARRVDQLVDAVNLLGSATLFCGPDGAGPVYKASGGKWPIEVLDAAGAHATKARFNLTPRHTEDFRAGVIYGLERRFVNPVMCVDVAIFRGDSILLVQKPTDDGAWRLPGGFVDVDDVDLETAAAREVAEEVKIEVTRPSYLGSALIDDWRYRGPERIMSTLWSCSYVFGSVTASDDVSDARWFNLDHAPKNIHKVHAALLDMALKSIAQKGEQA